MTRLTWDKSGERFYETGVDRGVFYDSLGVGTAWNGLVSVTEKNPVINSESYYLDGQQYYRSYTPAEFEASISAYTYPDLLNEYIGEEEIRDGLNAHQQIPNSFGFSYRTRIHNDTSGEVIGHKIHLIYNAIATPSDITRSSVNNSAEASLFGWDVKTQPETMTGVVSPTAHLVIDTRKIPGFTLGYLESVLYGANGITPKLPSPNEILNIFDWNLSWSGPLNILGTASSTKKKMTNLFVNPSFENMSTTIHDVRINYARNPSFEVNTSQWSDILGATLTRITTDAVNGTSCLKVDTNGTNGSGTKNNGGTASTHGWITGQSVSAAIWVKSASGVSVTVVLEQVTGATAQVVTGNGNWQRVIINSAIKSSSSVEPSIYAYIAGSHAATTFYLDAALIERTPAVGLDFNGSFTANGDYRYEWAGVAHESNSLMRANAAGTVGSTRCFGHQSVLWEDTRTKSLRVVPNDPSNSSYAYAFISPKLVTGKWYQLNGTLRLSAPLTGSQNAAARQLRMQHSGTAAFSATAPNTAGEHKLSVTFQVTDSAPTQYIQFMNGASFGNGDTWWDSVALFEVSGSSDAYPDLYFDGASGTITVRHQRQQAFWDGTAENSTSSVDYYSALDKEGTVGDAYIVEGNLWIYTNSNYWQNYGPAPAF